MGGLTCRYSSQVRYHSQALHKGQRHFGFGKASLASPTFCDFHWILRGVYEGKKLDYGGRGSFLPHKGSLVQVWVSAWWVGIAVCGDLAVQGGCVCPQLEGACLVWTCQHSRGRCLVDPGLCRAGHIPSAGTLATEQWVELFGLWLKIKLWQQAWPQVLLPRLPLFNLRVEHSRS